MSSLGPPSRNRAHAGPWQRDGQHAPRRQPGGFASTSARSHHGSWACRRWHLKQTISHCPNERSQQKPTLWALTLATTTAHTDTVDEDALLGLVAKAASLLWARWARSTHDDVALAVLPGADAEQKAHHIRLLVSPDLLHILVGSHC